MKLRVGRLYSGLQVSELTEAGDPAANEFLHLAGLSIGIGFLRILFPESQQFLEAKKSGKRTMTAAEFSKETRSMIAKQWKLCVYCIILMTWVSLARIETLEINLTWALN